jgi:hypothetical protein
VFILLLLFTIFTVQLQNNILILQLEALKLKHHEITTISNRFLVQNDSELESMFNNATIEEFWFPVSNNSVWNRQACRIWNEMASFDANKTETIHILPAFQSLVNLHSSHEWILNDTHNGWESTTQDFLMVKKEHVMTVHNVGVVIELTGQNESPFPNKRHKQKFIRDLLRIHVLRGEKSYLFGVITDMCRIVVVRLSGPAVNPTIVKTSITNNASIYIGQLLQCSAEQLGNTFGINTLTISFINLSSVYRRVYG